jgi:hypothetical protein
MDRLQLLSVFIAVAEEESFAAAARRLALSAPATHQPPGRLVSTSAADGSHFPPVFESRLMARKATIW